MVTKSILFVDDEPLVLKVLDMTFRNAGYTPLCSLNGVDALKILERNSIRLCFVDLRMPVMDGFVLCMRIKQLDPTVCVNALSGFVDGYTNDQYRKAGFDRVFSKPFKIEELLKVAHAVFQ